MAIATVTKIGAVSYLYEWSGTSPFRVYQSGKQLFGGQTTTDTSMIVYTSDLYEPPVIEVLDANDVYTPQTMLYPPFVTLQWRGITDASYYLVERNVGGVNEVQTVTITNGHNITSAVQTVTIGYNEKQIVTITDGSGADTFTLTLDGNTTSALDWDCTAVQMTTALEALPSIDVGDISITLNNLEYEIRFQGSLADEDVPELTAVGTGCTVTVTTFTGKYFQLIYDGEVTDELDWDASAATVQSALEGLSTIGAGNVLVTLNGLVYTITFQGTLANIPVSKLQSWGNECIATIAVVTEGLAANDHFHLTYSGQTTAALAWDASAATVQSALEALSTIQAGNVSVTLSNLVYTVTFQGTLAKTNVTAMTSSYVGCLATIATTVVGSADAWAEMIDGKIPESGLGYYKYEATGNIYSNTKTYYPEASVNLDDITTHSFRITPYDVNDYVGSYLEFDIFLVRSPSPPEVTMTYREEFLDASDWTSAGWTGSWATGWTHTVGNTTALSQIHAAVVGATYNITFTVTGRTAGTFTVGFGGETSAAKSVTGTYLLTASTVGGLIITPTTDFDGTIVLTMVSNLLTTSARV